MPRASGQLAQLPEMELLHDTIIAAPVGPPFGGMTVYTALLRGSSLFRNQRAIIFDTTPPVGRNLVWRRVAHALRQTLQLLSLIRRRNVRVTYFMTSGYTGFYVKGVMALLARAAGARSVLHPVGSFTNFYGSASLGRAAIKFILTHVDAVIAVEDRALAHMLSVAPRARIWLIPNPVDSASFGSTFTPRPARSVVQVLFAGAMVEGKGILDLIEAIRLYSAELGNARFVIIGAGALEAECRRRVASYNLTGLVDIRGWVDEATKTALLSESHVYCLPSHSEGTPLSVLEAMAAGLPVVATNVGGIPFAVRDGIDGKLVPARDTEALGRALLALIRDAGLRESMGASGFARVRKLFDIDIIAADMISNFNALATAGRH